MRAILRAADWIDRLNTRVGQGVRWLVLAMVVIGAYNAIVRYFDRYTGLGLSSNFYLELQWYLFSLVFLLCAAYTLKHDAHVRVDVLYGRLSARGKAIIDLAGTVLFLLPFCGLMIWVSWPAVSNSWEVMETSPDPGGLPRYLIKTVIPIAFFLLVLQGFSMLFRSVGIIAGWDAASIEDDADDGITETAPDPARDTDDGSDGHDMNSVAD